jgi:Flp pilus assembly protein TadG
VTRDLKARLASERGSILIMGLLLSIALLMAIGFAVDIGHAFLVRRQLSSVADQAALSGSQAIDVQALHEGHLELNAGQARAEALKAVSADPSLVGQASASTGSVTVTVRRRVPTILLGLVGLRTLTISAHATAAPRAP